MRITVTKVGSAITSACMAGAIGFCSITATSVPALADSASALTVVAPPLAKPFTPDVNALVSAGPASLGYLPGAWNVTPSGAFHYTIPLDVPDARRGMKPDLSLNYSGSTDDGLVGVGWTLSGFSSIARCPRRIASDGYKDAIANNEKDRYCLDGVPLIPIGNSEGTVGSQYKLLSNDNSIITITDVAGTGSGGGAVKFKLQGANGVVKLFQKNIAANASKSTVISALQSKDVSEHFVNVLWLLTSESDIYGNEIEYNYDVNVTNANNFSSAIKNEISYTPSSIEYSNVNGSYYRKVEFVYDKLSDISFQSATEGVVKRKPISSWEGGIQYTINKRLRSVVMYAPNPVSTEEVWRYELSYNDNISTPSNFSRLGSVKRCGAKGGCTWSKSFDWSAEGDEAKPKFSQYPLWPSVTVPWPIKSADNHLVGVHVADVNGDGLDDLYVEKKDTFMSAPTDARFIVSEVNSYQRGVAESFTPLKNVESLNFGSRNIGNYLMMQDVQQISFIDVNGDGVPEAFADDGQALALFKRSTGSPATYSMLNDAIGNPISTAQTNKVLWADLNGDGLADMILGENTNKTVSVIKENTIHCSSQCMDSNSSAEFYMNLAADIYDNPPKPYHHWFIRLATPTGLGGKQDTGLITPCPVSISNIKRSGRSVASFGSESWEEKTVFVDALGGKLVIKALDCASESNILGVDDQETLFIQSTSGVDGDSTLGHAVYLDLNGDGLDDAIRKGVSFLNTGNGYKVQSVPYDSFDPAWDSKYFDINGDGTDDRVYVETPNSTIAVRYANDMKHSSVISSLGINGIGVIPGDFNGDGLMDIASVERGSSSSTIRVYYREADPKPRLIRVRDAVANSIKETVATPTTVEISYKTPIFQRSETSFSGLSSLAGKDPHPPCNFMVVCHSAGMTVVDWVLDSTMIPEADSSSPVQKRAFRYFYERPISDRKSGVFLGFRAFSVWDRNAAQLSRLEYRRQTDSWPLGGKKYVLPYANKATDEFIVKGIYIDDNLITTSLMDAQLSYIHRDYTVHMPSHGGVFNTLLTDLEVKEYGGATLSQSASSQSGGPFSFWDGKVDVGGTHSAILERQSESHWIYDYDGFVKDTVSKVSMPLGSSTEINTPRRSITVGDYRYLGLLDSVTTTASESNGDRTTRKVKYEYDSKGQIDTVIDEPDTVDDLLKQKSKYYFDDNTGVLKGVSRIGKRIKGGSDIELITRFEYGTLLGEPAEHIYPSQIWQQNGNSQSGHLSSWIATHPALGLPVMSMDANGVMTQMYYDDSGRLRTIKQDGLNDTSFSYSARTRSLDNVVIGTTVQVTQGSQWLKSYLTATGAAVKTQWPGFDGSLNSEEFNYDVLGRLQQYSGPSNNNNGLITTYDYDSLGRTRVVNRPGNGQVDCSFTRFTQTCTDESGHYSYQEMDQNYRLALSINRDTAHGDMATEYTYYPFGLLKSVSDPDDHITSFKYDVYGRKTEVNHPDAGINKIYYNGLGEVSSVEQPALAAGDAAATYSESYVYDNFSRVKQVNSPDGITTYQYDTAVNGKGKLDYAISAFGIKSQYRYNNYGQTQGVDTIVNYGGAGATTYSLGYQYNNVGDISKITYPNVSAPGMNPFTVQYNYNALGYLSSITDAATRARFWEVSARDAMSNLKEGYLGDTVAGSLAADGRIRLSRDFDSTTGRLKQMAARVSGFAMDVTALNYGYYDNGQVRSKQDAALLRNETYNYDGVGRLTQWDLSIGGSANKNWAYAYEADGNISSVSGPVKRDVYTYSLNKPHQVTSIRTDTRSTLTSPWAKGLAKTYDYDARGRRKKTGTGSDIAYMFFNLPKTIGGGALAYDAFGNRVQRIKSDGSSTVYIGGLYEKRRANGGEEHIFHVTGAEGANIDVVYNAAASPIKKVEYAVKDKLGTSVAIINGTGSGFGSVMQRLYFDPFGKRITSAGDDFIASLTSHDRTGLTGHEYDDDVALVNMRGRMYDAKTRRFMTADPLALVHFGQSFNGYSYVFNDPVNLTDPSGFQPCQNESFDDLCDLGQGTSGGGASNGNLATGYQSAGRGAGQGAANAAQDAQNAWYSGGDQRDPFAEYGPRQSLDFGLEKSSAATPDTSTPTNAAKTKDPVSPLLKAGEWGKKVFSYLTNREKIVPNHNNELVAPINELVASEPNIFKWRHGFVLKSPNIPTLDKVANAGKLVGGAGKVYDGLKKGDGTKVASGVGDMTGAALGLAGKSQQAGMVSVVTGTVVVVSAVSSLNSDSGDVLVVNAIDTALRGGVTAGGGAASVLKNAPAAALIAAFDMGMMIGDLLAPVVFDLAFYPNMLPGEHYTPAIDPPGWDERAKSAQ